MKNPDFLISNFLGRLGESPEGFRGVPEACGYILTEFGLKRKHLDLIHTKFYDFAIVHAESKLNPAWIQPIQPGSTLDPVEPKEST